MARRYPYDTTVGALLHPAEGTVFFEEWDPVRDSANHDLLCAEMSRLAYAPEPVARASLAAIGFELRPWLGGESAGTRGTDGFVASSADRRLTIVAFRGTEPGKFDDLIADVNTLPADWADGGGQVHTGFLRAYSPVREAVRAALEGRGHIVFTGHSLGAALATLAAADHRPRQPALITFGSPRVGNRQFARLLAGLTVHRVVDCCDMVARIPPARFDLESAATLLRELTGARLPAMSFASIFPSTVGEDRFVDVGDLLYADRHGVLQPGISDQAREEDQREARRTYGAHGGGPGAGHVLREALQEALASALRSGDLARAFRGLVGGVGHALSAARVPLRDLADHAPINYVSIFSGRMP
jgi:hypothetical protein